MLYGDEDTIFITRGGAANLWTSLPRMFMVLRPPNHANRFYLIEIISIGLGARHKNSFRGKLREAAEQARGESGVNNSGDVYINVREYCRLKTICTLLC